MENIIKKVFIIESSNRNFLIDIDDLFEKYSKDYTDLIYVFRNDFDSFIFINLVEPNENNCKGYIIQLCKAKSVIIDYLQLLKAHKIEQIDIDLISNSGFIDAFLDNYEIKIKRKYVNAI